MYRVATVLCRRDLTWLYNRIGANSPARSQQTAPTVSHAGPIYLYIRKKWTYSFLRFSRKCTYPTLTLRSGSLKSLRGETGKANHPAKTMVPAVLNKRIYTLFRSSFTSVSYAVPSGPAQAIARVPPVRAVGSIQPRRTVSENNETNYCRATIAKIPFGLKFGS